MRWALGVILYVGKLNLNNFLKNGLCKYDWVKDLGNERLSVTPPGGSDGITRVLIGGI